MLVKHNLLFNNDKLTMPDMIEGSGEAELVNGTLHLYNISERVTKMTNNGYDERLSILVKEDDRFFVGLYGKFDAPFKLYKGEGYKTPYKKGDFYYIEAGAKNIFKAFHINGDIPFTGYIKAFAVYKGEAPDVYLPNINNLPEEKRGFLPPEGHYKEITPF